MKQRIEIVESLRTAARNPYAWPGGYPTAIILADGGVICCTCLKDNYRLILGATSKPGTDDQWEFVAQQIVYENAEGMTCDHCQKVLEAAYGD